MSATSNKASSNVLNLDVSKISSSAKASSSVEILLSSNK